MDGDTAQGKSPLKPALVPRAMKPDLYFMNIDCGQEVLASLRGLDLRPLGTEDVLYCTGLITCARVHGKTGVEEALAVCKIGPQVGHKDEGTRIASDAMLCTP
jgi:hypothetical protein